MEKTKTIKLSMGKPDERELWEWLQTLPHGTFSDDTKKYWLERMRAAKEGKD